MNELMKYKTEFDDGVIEFEVISPTYLEKYTNERLAILEEQGELLAFAEKDIEEQIKALNSQIDNPDSNIGKKEENQEKSN